MKHYELYELLRLLSIEVAILNHRIEKLRKEHDVHFCNESVIARKSAALSRRSFLIKALKQIKNDK